jgi:hypothetical protein
MAYILMLHRLFNKGGQWHKAGTLDPKAWKRFEFDMSWENLNKMYSLRKYYIEIAPPFSKESVGRHHEMDLLHDDIMYYHVRQSWYWFIAWVVFTTFFIDMDKFDVPYRPEVTDDQSAHDFPKLREGFLV